MLISIAALVALLAGEPLTLDLRRPVSPPPTFDPKASEIKPSYICWVTDLEATKTGVRIYFSRTGGPLFVSHKGGLFKPGDEPIDRTRSDDAALDGILGDKFFPQNSHHDNCSLTVVKVDGRIGIEASAYTHLPGLPEEQTTAFYPAHD